MKARGLTIICSLLVGTVLASCAGYTIQRDGCGAGYDVYGSAPYLLGTPSIVAGDANNKQYQMWTFKVIYLPDYSRRYRIRSWAGLGKADFAFSFKDGWQLEKIEDRSDNTSVAESIKSLVSAAKDILGNVELGSGGQTPDNVVNKPILYRIEFDKCGMVAGLTKLKEADLDFDGPKKQALGDCCPSRK